MVNEVLTKIVRQNICVLIQETYELGISATFWQEETAEPQREPALVGALDADSDGLDWIKPGETEPWVEEYVKRSAELANQRAGEVEHGGTEKD